MSGADAAVARGASVRLLAFAGSRDRIGAAEVEVDLPPACTAEQLLGVACARWPALAPYRTCLRVAVNGAYAALGDEIPPGAEVALIPPVAGG